LFLFVKTKYFCYSLFDLSIKIFFLYLDRFLIRYKKHLVPFTIVVGLVLISIFNITSILGIRNSYVIAKLAIEINGLFIISI
jgi:hypothetical protein